MTCFIAILVFSCSVISYILFFSSSCLLRTVQCSFCSTQNFTLKPACWILPFMIHPLAGSWLSPLSTHIHLKTLKPALTTSSKIWDSKVDFRSQNSHLETQKTGLRNSPRETPKTEFENRLQNFMTKIQLNGPISDLEQQLLAEPNRRKMWWNDRGRRETRVKRECKRKGEFKRGEKGKIG